MEDGIPPRIPTRQRHGERLPTPRYNRGVRVGVTQSIMITPSGEVRDCLDHRWVTFLGSLGGDTIPLPNAVSNAADYLATASLDGLVLTGGDDLASYRDQPPPLATRDSFELAALKWAIRTGVPILAVCRGFQLVVTRFGGEIKRVPGHAGTIHRLHWNGAPFGPNVVSSYHNWSLMQSPETLEPIAYASDETIEAALHRQHSILGLMWHPERVETGKFRGSTAIGQFLRRGKA